MNSSYNPSIISVLLLLVFSIALSEHAASAFVAQSKVRIRESVSIAPRHQRSATKSHDDGLITTITSEEEYHCWLKENNDKLCVVKFYASWCKSCQKFGMQFHRVAKKELEEEQNVAFGQIEFGGNVKLCKQLNIKRLPTIHMYKNEDLIIGFPCGPKKFATFSKIYNKYKSMSYEELLFEKQMNEGDELVQEEILKSNQLQSDKEKKEPVLHSAVQTSKANVKNSDSFTGKTTDELLQQLKDQVEAINSKNPSTKEVGVSTMKMKSTIVGKSASNKNWWDRILRSKF